jgi:peptidoglycan/LPS O-acetylase OafA/YrhL
MKDISLKKYKYIDAIRGFAILGVVLVHTSHWVPPESPILSKIAAQGARGVQLFYIASALTLFLSMAARKQQEDRPVLSFFIRRFFRIAPLFYCAIFIYTGYSGLSARYHAPNGLEWWYIPLTASFMHGWHPETITSVVPGGWSIAVEMTFYMFVPYLFLKLKDMKSTLVALILSIFFSRILSSAIFYILSPYYPEAQQYLVRVFAYLWFFSQLPVFILGILLYHITIEYPQNDTRTASLLLFASLFLFFAFLTVETFADLMPKHYFYGVAFLLFSLSLYYSPHRFLVNRFTVLVGKLSYSIYLVHFMVVYLLRRMFSSGFWLDGDSGFILAYVLVLTSAICISYVSHNLVEIPGIKLGKHIVKKL